MHQSRTSSPPKKKENIGHRWRPALAAVFRSLINEWMIRNNDRKRREAIRE